MKKVQELISTRTYINKSVFVSSKIDTHKFNSRYLGQSENKDISEKCYELDLDIEDAVERKEKAVGRIEIASSIDGNIRKGLQKIGCI